jgi:ectoine hydroxylase-related dioxygenase (phytanoyl-CoA dioxygenase family)
MSARLNATREQLRSTGFTVIEALFTDGELQAVEDVLDPLVLGADSANARRRRELSANHRGSAVRQPEFSRPTAAVPALRRMGVYAKCEHVATELLGRRVHYLFDHAIYKMPRSGAGTPWHQDQAYLGPSVPIQSVHFWIPLQETDTSNGCLRFVRSRHPAGLQPHIRAYAANPHVLRAAGDYAHVHSSGVNESNHIRKAWIIHFGDKSIWYKRMMQLRAVTGRLGWAGGGRRVRSMFR